MHPHYAKSIIECSYDQKTTKNRHSTGWKRPLCPTTNICLHGTFTQSIQCHHVISAATGTNDIYEIKQRLLSQSAHCKQQPASTRALSVEAMVPEMSPKSSNAIIQQAPKQQWHLQHQERDCFGKVPPTKTTTNKQESAVVAIRPDRPTHSKQVPTRIRMIITSIKADKNTC